MDIEIKRKRLMKLHKKVRLQGALKVWSTSLIFAMQIAVQIYIF